jgi:hypothetical protein
MLLDLCLRPRRGNLVADLSLSSILQYAVIVEAKQQRRVIVWDAIAPSDKDLGRLRRG